MSTKDQPDHRSLPVLNEHSVDWETRVGTTLIRFHHRVERRAVELLAAHGLTLPQFDVLATLWHGEGISQQELAERLLVTKGNVVGIIDRTSAAGWLERRTDPDDRRANRLYLTVAGRKLLAEAWPDQTAMLKRIYGRLTVGELRLMHELLERLDSASQAEG